MYWGVAVAQTSSQDFKALLITDVVLMTVGVALCQAVIALRVWYLFSRNKLIRRFSALLYIVCISSTWVSTGVLFDRYLQEVEQPNFTRNPSIFAFVYAPALVNHSVLFALTTYKYMASDRFQRGSSLLGGFLKEGLIMYTCAMGSLLYTIITISSFTNVSHLDVYYTGLQGGFVVGATLVSVCHALLSIRSISATLHVDPAWLLNHAELSRVQWTKGDHEGEIFVELNGPSDIELPMMNLSHTDIADAVQSLSDSDGFGVLGTPIKSY
ncbi:uncharacterized protein EDB91DRAFT_1242014 [Suillus paluster]|uniref:uncharacterized protein n=1 Tax=Suillus paluster TaxID=48578 RepID=UPI001B86F66F|nr:uncharacterized protein EDB91DRAFT_1242014 [Suillus paluster]KAG1754769.1 hypothetical protein EDB91DRAFT_1242014 [Suillus paluster]